MAITSRITNYAQPPFYEQLLTKSKEQTKIKRKTTIVK